MTNTASAPAAGTVRKITPVLIVDRVEPSVAFWRDRLGFQVTAEVPHEGHLGFAILVGDGVELMYQSRASVAADVPPEMPPPADATTYLFVEVSDLNAVERAIAGTPVVMARRKTFYGMEEIGVREPGGHVVTFAQRV
ncbi:MAG: VOC family protein [Gemmatimonadaceae bacterium]